VVAGGSGPWNDELAPTGSVSASCGKNSQPRAAANFSWASAQFTTFHQALT
jgi:hypothetical protein